MSNPNPSQLSPGFLRKHLSRIYHENSEKRSVSFWKGLVFWKGYVSRKSTSDRMSTHWPFTRSAVKIASPLHQICTHCGKYVTNLLEHIARLHSEDQAHQCNECLKTFPSKGKLNEHFKSAHTGELKAICDVSSFLVLSFGTWCWPWNSWLSYFLLSHLSLGLLHRYVESNSQTSIKQGVIWSRSTIKKSVSVM